MSKENKYQTISPKINLCFHITKHLKGATLANERKRHGFHPWSLQSIKRRNMETDGCHKCEMICNELYIKCFWKTGIQTDGYKRMDIRNQGSLYRRVGF